MKYLALGLTEFVKKIKKQQQTNKNNNNNKTTTTTKNRLCE